jgi:hypothetical protein
MSFAVVNANWEVSRTGFCQLIKESQSMLSVFGGWDVMQGNYED